MGEFTDYFKQKKNLLNLLVLGILVLAMPLGINLIRQQQILRSKAAVDPIVFTGANVQQKTDGTWVALQSQIVLTLTSPLGPSASSSAVQTVQSGNILMSLLENGLVGKVYAAEDPNVGGCGSPHFVYNQCVGCNTSQSVYQDDCGNYTTGSNQDDGGCASWCSTPPPPDDSGSGSGGDCNCEYTDLSSYSGQSCASGYAVYSGSDSPCQYDSSCSSFKNCVADTPPTPTPKPGGIGSAADGPGGCCDPGSQYTNTDRGCRYDSNVNGFREVCDIDNDACTSGFSCRSETGCALDTDCGFGKHCEDGQCKDGPSNTNCKVAASIEARFNASANLTVPSGTKVTAGVYRNTTGVPMGADVNTIKPVDVFTANITGPNGYSLNIDPAKETDLPTTLALGKYTLKGTCGTNLTATATLTVVAASPSPSASTPSSSCTLDPAKLNPLLPVVCTDCIADPSRMASDVQYVKGQGNASCNTQQVVTYMCNGGISTENQAGCNGYRTGACATQCNVTPTTPPGATTVSFRVAENPTDFTEAGPNGWQLYTSHPMTGVNYEFKDKTPGLKTIFVQFKDSNNNVSCGPDKQYCAAQITLLGAGPEITGCGLSFEGNTASINLTGKNFGTDKGKVTSGTNDLTVGQWQDDSIQAVWPAAAPENKTLDVVVTNSFGQTGPGTCSAIAQLSLGAKVFCRRPSDHATQNVEMVLAGAFEGGTLTRQKVTIDKEGLVQGLSQKLEAGKQYRISLKAPLGLRKAATFTASSGTTNLPNFILPIGDIFPIDGGDQVINSLDKSELNRQWIVAQAATNRTGDFNKDTRVNSIDWACMRYDFNVPNDPEPTVGAPSQPASSSVSFKLGTITPEDNGFANYHLSWTELPGTVKYNIYSKGYNASYGAPLVTTDKSSYDFHFPVNANYTMKVSACNSADSCIDSNEVILPYTSMAWPPFADANTFREFIFKSFGFNDAAQTLIKNNSTIVVKDVKNPCNGGGGWMPSDKKVELNCTQYEAAVHELSHVWWHTYRLQNPETVKSLVKDVVRLADGDGSADAVAFAKGYVNGIGSWKGMYCTDNGCADPHNIKDNDFDLTEAATNAKINDWEIYAGFSSWTMGKFKDGSHALPSYMWKYFEPEFKGVVSEKPHYEGGHP